MPCFQPSPQFLFEGAAGELKPWQIAVVAQALGGIRADHHRRRIGHHAETAFAEPEVLFRLLAIRHVAKDQHHAFDRTLSGTNGGAAIVNRKVRSRARHQDGVIRQPDHSPFPQHPANRAFHHGARLLVARC